ncbi:MAG TPA: MFS transporter [Candidatus Cybelea sp.]|jgi:MFS family permease
MSRLLWTLSLGVFAGALDLSVLSPALPALGLYFNVQTGDLAWVFTLYLLVTVVSIAIASAMADRFGRRPVYLACISLFAIGSLVAILAPSYGVFLAARGIQALGAGGIFPVATATIGDVVPAGNRGAALGIVAATWGLAAILGPSLGGLITHYLSWRYIFAVNIPLAGVVFWMAMQELPAQVPLQRRKLDLIGLTLLCVGLLAVTEGLIAMRVAVGIGGLGILAAFVVYEFGADDPLLPLDLLRTTQLLRTYALEIVIGILEGSLFFIPAALVAALGLSAAAAGFAAALGALTFVLVIPAAGRALDRIGSRDVLLAGTVCSEIGLAAFALGFTSLPLALLAIVVAGAGFGALLGAPTRFIVTNETPRAVRATAVGLLSQALIVGQILGSSLAGGLVGAAGNDIAGFRHAYLAFAAVAFVAVALAASLKSRAQERKRPIEEAA